MKKTLAWLLTLCMILSMIPMSVFAADADTGMTGGEKLYLRPNANWLQSDARFAAYFHDGNNTWAGMTKVEGETDLYEVTVPDGSWTNVIFCRMNPATTENNWSNKWNQTGELTYDGTNNLCTIKDGQWDCGTNVTWSIYESEPTEPTEPTEPETDTVTLYFKNTVDWSTVNAYAWGDGYTLAAWPGMNMTPVEGETDLYSITVPTEAKYIIFNNGSTQTDDLTIPTDGKNLYDYSAGTWSTYGASTEPTEPTEPETDTVTLYFKNTVDWSTVNAYAWGDGYTLAAWPGTMMTQVEGETGIYSIEVSTEAEYIIFNSGSDQTGDISIPTDGANLYDYSAGTWSTYGASTEPETDTVTLYFKNTAGWSTVNAFAWDNGRNYVLGNWPGTTMTQVEGETDLYSIEVSTEAEYIIFNNGSGDAGNSTPDLTIPTDGANLYDYSAATWSTYGASTEPVADVAAVNDTPYATIEDALSHWTSGATLKLLADVTYDNQIQVPSGKLDLNGQTLTANYGISVAENVDLTICDSSEEQDGALTSTNYTAITVSGGTLIIEGGSFAAGADCGMIQYSGGVLDLSNYSGVKDISVYIDTDAAVNPGDDTIKLPEGYCFYGEVGAVANLAVGDTYTIGEGQPGDTTTYAVTISEDIANGSVRADKDTAKAGETVTLTVTPDAGYELDTLTVTDANDNEVTVMNNTFTMPASNVTVTATFKEITYTVTVDDGITNGTVTANKTETIAGNPVTLNVTPNAGYVLGSLTVTYGENNTAVTVEDSTFTMPADDVTITATFNETWTKSGNYDISWYNADAFSYTLSDAKELAGLAVLVNGLNDNLATDFTNKQIFLGADIDLSDHYWTPIGTYDSPFKGSFVGNDHTVSGLNIDITYLGSSNYMAAGLFGFIEKACVQNVTVKGTVKITSLINDSTPNAVNAGLLVGCMTDAFLYNCYTDGTVMRTGKASYSRIGGMVGLAQHSVMINCGSYGTMSGSFDYAGGLVGYMTAGYDEPWCMLNCYSQMNISATNASKALGGLAGYIADDAVNNYFSGTINCNGGTCGLLFGSVSDSYSSSSSSVTFIPYIKYNYYFETTGINAIGSSASGLYTAEYAEAYSSNSDLLNKLNTNLDAVSDIIMDHLGHLKETEWADLVAFFDGDSVTAATWVSENGAAPVHGAYTVTVDGNITNGTVAADKTEMIAGEAVTLTVTPDAGYELDTLTVTDSEGQIVDVSDDNTFTMPAGNVTVSATFKVCEHDYDGGVCNNCGILDAVFMGSNLVLEGNIGINFYFRINDTIVNSEDAIMRFTFEDGRDPIEIPVKDAKIDTTSKPGTTLYVFSCDVFAKQMTDTVTAQIVMSEHTSKAYEHSVVRYAEMLLNSQSTAYTEECKALVKAMLNYGANAQINFDYHTERLANANLTDQVPEVLDNVFDAYDALVTPNDAIGTFAGSNLVLESTTTVNVYFKPADGVSIESLTFTVDGESVTPELTTIGEEDYYMITIENIAAQDLEKTYEVVASDGTESSSYTVSAFSYCHDVMKQATDTVYTEALKNTLKAMYLYNDAANNYFDN